MTSASGEVTMAMGRLFPCTNWAWSPWGGGAGGRGSTPTEAAAFRPWMVIYPGRMLAIPLCFSQHPNLGSCIETLGRFTRVLTCTFRSWGFSFSLCPSSLLGTHIFNGFTRFLNSKCPSEVSLSGAQLLWYLQNWLFPVSLPAMSKLFVGNELYLVFYNSMFGGLSLVILSSFPVACLEWTSHFNGSFHKNLLGKREKWKMIWNIMATLLSHGQI